MLKSVNLNFIYILVTVSLGIHNIMPQESLVSQSRIHFVDVGPLWKAKVFENKKLVTVFSDFTRP